MSAKLQTLTAYTTVDPTSLLYMVVDPTGTPLDRKVTFGDLKNSIITYAYYADTFAGADLGAKINAAYAALPSAGGTIYIPGGTSSYSTPIVFGTNGKPASLVGPGAGSTFLKYTPTSGNAITLNYGNPTGHLINEIRGFTLMGKSSLIAAGQTNTNTSVGIYYGGANGCPGVNTHDINVNGFGSNWEIGANAYMLNFTACSNSGGNGGQASRGSLVHINTASNSGERNNFIACNFTDPGNSDATNAIYIANAATASNSFMNCSIDNAQLTILGSNGGTSLMSCHIENPGSSTYPEYIPILGASSDSSTQISVIGCEFANSASGRTWTTIIRHGGQLYAAGNHINNYNGFTVTNFVLHDLDNGLATDYIVQTQVQGGALTNLIGGSGGVAFSLATGNAAVHNVSNSYTIGLRATGSNTNEFFSGSSTVGTFDHSGNWKIGVAASPGAHTFYGRILALAASVASAGDVTLGNANAFDVTGTTTMNTISATGWTSGSIVTLRFSTSLTVKHNTAGAGAVFLLSGAADFSATANDSLTLQYDGTSWREIARTVI